MLKSLDHSACKGGGGREGGREKKGEGEGGERRGEGLNNETGLTHVGTN